MNNKTMELTNAGVKITDDWKEICEFCRKIEKMINASINNNGCVDNFSRWRPRKDEEENEIIKKTAEEASIGPKKVEKEYKGTKKELKEASRSIVNSAKCINDGKTPFNDLKGASMNVGRIMSTKSLRVIRKMEKIIYEKFMLKFNPYYFDTEEFSVNLEKKKGESYTLTMNISNERMRKKIKEKLKEDA